MARRVSIQYRQLRTEDSFDGVDLKAMVVDVLRRREGVQQIAENAKLRIIDLDQDGTFVILNKLMDPGTWDGPIFGGQLIHLQAGSDVHAVMQSLDEDTNEFVLERVSVDERARVLKGALYFVIVGNHVGLIEGQQVRGGTLERYLTSLLQRAGEMEPGQIVTLNASFRAADGKELSTATEISIAAEPNRGPEAPPRERDEVVERDAGQARDRATVFDVLRTLGWSPQSLESLRADVPDDGWIEGLFKIRIKRKAKAVPIQRATINEALRNIDPEDLGLRGNGTERGGVVKLTAQRSVDTIGSLLDPADAIEQIVNTLRVWAMEGKIDCNFAA